LSNVERTTLLLGREGMAAVAGLAVVALGVVSILLWHELKSSKRELRVLYEKNTEEIRGMYTESIERTAALVATADRLNDLIEPIHRIAIRMEIARTGNGAVEPEP
jgi:hypothetical protein